MEKANKKMTVLDVIKLHGAMKDAKVSKLSKESTLAYIDLKIRISEEIEKIQEHEKKIFKETIPEGLKEGSKVSQEKAYEIESLRRDMLDGYHSESVKEDINPHILSGDEIFDSILGIELNDGLSSEAKGFIMKYLKKMTKV